MHTFLNIPFEHLEFFIDMKSLGCVSQTCRTVADTVRPLRDKRITLTQAIETQSAYAIRYLHDHGILPSIPVTYISPEIIDLLYQYGINPGGEYLQHAIVQGHLDMAGTLVEHGVPTSNYLCILASIKDNIEVLRWLHSKTPQFDLDSCIQVSRGSTTKWLKSQMTIPQQCKFEIEQLGECFVGTILSMLGIPTGMFPLGL
jgi:hypothetical protein